MLSRKGFRHIRIRSLIVFAFGTMVFIGFRANLLSNEAHLSASPSRTRGWAPQQAHNMQYTSYDWRKSTEENYMVDENDSCGKYGYIRARLDHTYHSNYSKSRQDFHDSIIDLMLLGTRIVDRHGNTCVKSTHPWIVFTAGAMGAGKSWTIRNLAVRGYFPVQAFVTVDPDEIRRHLPEFDVYVNKTPDQAGEFTRKEAGYIAEILTHISLQRGHNVLVDGSLRDHRWYTTYFASLKAQRATLKIAILHVSAPRDAVMKRAEHRARITGRVVPRTTIELAMTEVPKSVEVLAPLCDFYADLYNAGDAHAAEIRTENLTWENFSKVWAQTCPITKGNMSKTDCTASIMECEATNLLSSP